MIDTEPMSTLYEFDGVVGEASYNRIGLVSVAKGTDTNWIGTQPQLDSGMAKWEGHQK